MEGRSFVGTASAVEDDIDAVLGEPTVTNESVLTKGLAVLRTLSDLCELTRASQPIPGPTAVDDGDERLDASVATVLETVYDRGDATPADVDRLARACDCGLLAVADGSVHVPLARAGPAAGNWAVVFAFVHDRLDALREKGAHVRDRIARSGKAETVFERVWRSVVETLADIRRVLRHTLTRHRWVSHRAGRSDDRPQRFGSWVVERLDT
ncbi:hypothetical protein HZS55_04280 [Halosimplex rubrum]|uniref:Uncharacterized protein n=1 Tax=Halosimplex rubrum TaxID=869889 RepID=A0A7D5T457_9EURY|nr:hypothetical protein [Halosimplex rubrum]QLH76569.1 hypothetical protein HZS55_04280 [Halosimplex rubrum]